MDKLTSEEMRRFNRHQVYRLIYEKKKISRQEIADTLQLSLPTVTLNLKSMEAEGLIFANGFFESTGGRKSVVYSCVTDRHIAIGVHIKKHKISIVSVNIYGEIMGRTQVMEEYMHDRDYYRSCGEHIRNFIQEENISSKQILGVGIALTALLSRDRRSVKKSILLGTSETTIEDFEEWIDYPCQLYHDSEAAANAELWFSPDIADAMYLGINQYLNGMLIMNGKVHAGREFSGGVVEHLTLYPGGRTCYCGKKGCLTCYCSGHVLYSDETGARDQFFADLRSGDVEASRKWNEFISDMAIAIGSLYSVLDCDFILGGTVRAYMTEQDVERLQQLVRKDSHFAPTDDFIRLGHNDVEVCARGAAISYIKEFVENL